MGPVLHADLVCNTQFYCCIVIVAEIVILLLVKSCMHTQKASNSVTAKEHALYVSLAYDMALSEKCVVQSGRKSIWCYAT